MKTRLIFIFPLVAFASSAQDNRITINGNLRTPGNSNRGMFPLMGFDDGFRIGGVGVGYSRFTELNKNYDLKLSVNLTRQAYWSGAIQLNKGPNPNDVLGYTNSITGELYTGLFGIVHRKLPNKFSIGTGLGMEVLVISAKIIDTNDKLLNHEFKPVLPVVPLELSWKGDLMIYNIHGEIGLLNRYRGHLRNYEKDLFGLISFEVGIKI